MRSRLVFAVLSVVLMAGGCASVPPVPQEHFYRLSEALPASPGRELALHGVLAVGAIDSAGLYRERAIVYTQPGRPTELLRYNYHSWIDGPPRLIQDQLQTYLRRSGVASLVVADDARTRWDYLLSGKLRRFERVMQKGGASQAAVDLELRLDRRGATRPLLLREYQASVPVTGDAVGDAADAFSAALQDIYGQLLGDVAALPQDSAAH